MITAFPLMQDLDLVAGPAATPQDVALKAAAYARLMAVALALPDPTLYQAALHRFGTIPQMLQTMEECAELIQALNHHIRGKGTKDAIAGEIADVQIMLDQMTLVVGIDRVQDAMNRKIERLARVVQP